MSRRTEVACSAAGCRALTSEGKPFCEAHVELLPYARVVIRREATRQAEIKALRRGVLGRRRRKSLLVAQAAALLEREHGMSLDRLRYMLSLGTRQRGVELARRLAGVLERRGLAVVSGAWVERAS